MKKLLTWCLLTLSITAYGQKEAVMARLEELGIKANFLNTSLQDHDAVYYFNFKTITNNGTNNIVDAGYFDPRKPIGDRWVLETVNGESPTKKEFKKFDKLHNTEQPEINGKVADDSWKIDSETDDMLAISFQYDRATLPKKYAFLADCTGRAFINKNTHQLERAEFTNDKPLKVKIFNVQDLKMTIEYQHIPEDDVFVIKNEDLDMKVKLLGQLVEVEEVNEYDNYKKVK